MYCKKCGNMISDRAVFCPKCGNAIQQKGAIDNQTNQKAVIGVSNASELTQEQTSIADLHGIAEEKEFITPQSVKKKVPVKKIIIFAAVLLIVAAAAIVSIHFVINRNVTHPEGKYVITDNQKYDPNAENVYHELVAHYDTNDGGITYTLKTKNKSYDTKKYMLGKNDVLTVERILENGDKQTVSYGQGYIIDTTDNLTANKNNVPMGGNSVIDICTAYDLSFVPKVTEDYELTSRILNDSSLSSHSYIGLKYEFSAGTIVNFGNNYWENYFYPLKEGESIRITGTSKTGETIDDTYGQGCIVTSTFVLIPNEILDKPLGELREMPPYSFYPEQITVYSPEDGYVPNYILGYVPMEAERDKNPETSSTPSSDMDGVEKSTTNETSAAETPTTVEEVSFEEKTIEHLLGWWTGTDGTIIRFLDEGYLTYQEANWLDAIRGTYEILDGQLNVFISSEYSDGWRNYVLFADAEEIIEKDSFYLECATSLPWNPETFTKGLK